MSEKSDRPGIALQCLGGLPADEGLLRRWELFLTLAPSARERVWEVLRPILARSPDTEIRDHALRVAEACDAAPDQLALALQACQLLVTRASEADLDANSFGRDLGLLSADHEHGAHARDVLLRGYDEARRDLRQRLAHEAVLSHGRLATAVEWRVDRVLLSGRCTGLDVTLPLLTISYREGTREERVTFQLSSEVVVQLQAFCNTLISAEAGIGDTSAASRPGDDDN